MVGGHHHDPDVPRRGASLASTHPADHFEPIHTGHVNIEQERIEVADRCESCERGGTIVGGRRPQRE